MTNLIAYTDLQFRLLQTVKNANQTKNETHAHDLIKYWVRLLIYMADLRKHRVDRIFISGNCGDFRNVYCIWQESAGETVPSIFPLGEAKGGQKRTP